MDSEKWLTGWKAIGEYIGKSAKTAQRYARNGMPFYRDSGGRPMAKPSMIDKYILALNRYRNERGNSRWQDKGIRHALHLEYEREKEDKDFNERLIHAQRPVRSRF